MPLFHNNALTVSKLNFNIDADLDLGNLHSLSASFVECYPTGHIGCKDDNDGMVYHGGTTLSNTGAELVLYGKTAPSTGDIELNVPNAAGNSIHLFTVTGKTDTPVLNLNSNRISSVLSPTTNGDALIFDDWTSWSPTISYTGFAWGSPAVYAYWQKTGKTVFIQVTISTADTNAGTILSITLPVSPRANSVINPLATFLQNTNAYTFVHETLAYIDQSGTTIQFQAFPATTDGQLCRVMIQGFYEVS